MSRCEICGNRQCNTLECAEELEARDAKRRQEEEDRPPTLEEQVDALKAQVEELAEDLAYLKREKDHCEDSRKALHAKVAELMDKLERQCPGCGR